MVVRHAAGHGCLLLLLFLPPPLIGCWFTCHVELRLSGAPYSAPAKRKAPKCSFADCAESQCSPCIRGLRTRCPGCRDALALHCISFYLVCFLLPLSAIQPPRPGCICDNGPILEPPSLVPYQSSRPARPIRAVCSRPLSLCGRSP